MGATMTCEVIAGRHRQALLLRWEVLMDDRRIRRRAGALALLACVAASAGSIEAHEKSRQETNDQPRREQMTNINEVVVSYLAAWNERDPKRRRELVAKTWADDGSYLDAHRQGAGHAAIDAMLAATQEMFPGYRLRLVSGIEAHHGHARFSWAAGGTPEAPLYLGGTDVVTLGKDGRLESVIGFVDAAPAH
jgi:hypothetical protein